MKKLIAPALAGSALRPTPENGQLTAGRRLSVFLPDDGFIIRVTVPALHHPTPQGSADTCGH